MTRHVHIVGIGGAGMSAIARVLHERGETVTGSDKARSDYSQALEAAGVMVWIGHSADAVEGADLVLASSAIPADNVEIASAQALEIPVVRRPQFLGELIEGYRTIAVAGTHGKTTTTAMIAWILRTAGLDPSYIVGGTPTDLEFNARHGSGDLFVIEADEYDRTFLGLRPDIAVITNVEHDHPDHYPTADEFTAAFAEFAGLVSELLVVCADDPGAADLEGGAARVTYGLAPSADWRAEDLGPNDAGGLDFLAIRSGEVQGLIRLRVPGEHNVLNALGALAAVEPLGLEFAVARSALSEFHGVERRFQVIGEAGGVTVIDDYAHHPTEIRATLASARARYPESEIWAVFQPHTYSRTRQFAGALKGAFGEADHLIVTEVFAAREAPDPEISGRALAGTIEGGDVRHIGDLGEAARALLGAIGPGAVLITLSAGDANRVGREVLAGLRVRS